ncbi:MAG: YbhB/YbcL family Raf kinase inhibitor-like protein [Sphingomonas sp.]|nr:YbhB/YbcL family Raf kinase inhibitor-like protein [Sphingomonas sp.]
MIAVVDRPEAAGGRYLAQLSSPALKPNSYIPKKYVSISPPLAWKPVPGAAGYVAMVEDIDAGDRARGLPFLHWIAWNIPYDAVSLPEGASGKRTAKFVEGINGVGKVGYFGPHPPPGRPHRYVFELLAVSSPIRLTAGASRDDVLKAIRGRVVGAGEFVGFYANAR